VFLFVRPFTPDFKAFALFLYFVKVGRNSKVKDKLAVRSNIMTVILALYGFTLSEL
jgi:hypothetical protein